MTFILMSVYSGGYHALNGRVLSGFVIIPVQQMSNWEWGRRFAFFNGIILLSVLKFVVNAKGEV